MTPEQQAYAHQVADWAVFGREGYDQGDWLSISYPVDDDSYEEPYELPIEKIREGSCGTQMCIAGRVAVDRAPKGTKVRDGEYLVFSSDPGDYEHVSTFAARELGLTAPQANTVFYAITGEASARLHYLADHPDARPEDLLNITRLDA